MTLAELLTELRTTRGLSQEDLAARTGVSVRAIGDVERGTTRRPHRDTIRALADGLALAGDERAGFERAARVAPPASTRARTGRPPALPAPVSSILGRDHELASLGRLLRDRAVRLVTITGPGGVGKTRLAVEAAWRVSGGFDRTYAVDLSPLARPEDVPQAVAVALGCRTAGLPPADAVAALIGTGRWLVVLDSFEHVAGAAGVVSGLLAACPRLTVLATSRAPLALRGEHVRPLAPLAVPAGDGADPTVLAASPAVALLVERTSAVRPGFALTSRNAAGVARLCQRLDGLPLAIELAAAQLRTQEPAELLAHLEPRLTALTAGTVDLPDRHQTLRRTVEWSTGRLAERDRLLLGTLAVFAGGAAPDALRAVAAAPGLDLARPGAAGPDPAALDASVSLLAAQSLVTVADRAGAARVGMLDTIREVAVDLLAATELDSAARRAHAGYFLDLVRAAGYERVDGELDNVRAATDWSARHDPGALDAPLARALTGYFVSRGQFAEASRTLAAVAASAADDAARAWALHGTAVAANEAGDHEAALRAAGESAGLFEKLGESLGRGTALTVIGNAYKALGRYADAEGAHRECLALADAVGDRRRVTIALNNLGTLAQDRGEHALAIEHYTASLEIKQELGDDRGTAVSLVNLGGLDNDLGRYDAAAGYLRQAVELFGSLGEQPPQAFALSLLAEAELGLGRLADAATTAARALELARAADYRTAIGQALARLGDVALATGDHDTAARFLEDSLEYAAGPPEVARTLEHLAAARAGTTPHEAGQLLARADQIRRANQTPVPPADRALVAGVRQHIDGTDPDTLGGRRGEARWDLLRGGAVGEGPHPQGLGTANA